jgi:hypothetical protein
MCPNINLLKTYKVFPRVQQFNYLKDLFFLYVYMDPFQELKKPLAINIDNQDYCFAYTPFYIGKGTGAGYRHHQHLAAFKNNTENNKFKVAAFNELSSKMATAAAKQEHDKPWTIKEYQGSYIVIIKTFEDPKQLLKFEMQMINKIGTLWDKTGPLTNRIKNAYAFDNLATKRDFEF